MTSEPARAAASAFFRMSHLLAGLALAAFLAVVWALFDQSGSPITRAVTVALGDPGREWELPGLYLLMALPTGAVVVVFVRTILGWQTFGLFTPMLLALAYLQSGPVLGPTISTAAILVGMASAPVLRRLEMSRVAFLGALIAIVVTALGALAINFNQPVLISAFPVVVTALVVERWWNAWESEGPSKAMRMTVTTLVVALAIQWIVAAPPVLHLAETAPLVLPVMSLFLMILLGRYKGLRLSEIARFRAVKGK